MLLLSAGNCILGQAGRGGISGTITDPSGALVPGAKVTALDHATGITQSTVSTAAGLYSFVSLNPGDYEVKASRTGFEKRRPGQCDRQRGPGQRHQHCASRGRRYRYGHRLADCRCRRHQQLHVGQLISAETIDRVPLLFRNVYDLVQLSAGVTPSNGSPNSADGAQINNISSGRPGVDVSSYSINGAVLGSVYYMLDGSPLGIAENNIAAIIPMSEIPEDGVDEYRVETQNTPASYQSGAAGVISLVSKSGGDKFHGDAFGVFRPDVLAANEYFNKQNQLLQGLANAPQSFHRYQEGGPSAGRSCTRNCSSLAITRQRSRRCMTDRTTSRFLPPQSARAIFQPTLIPSTIRPSPTLPPDLWPERARLLPATSSPTRTRLR